ncbi:MAG: ATP-binding protein [Anaerolineales bacterium]|nr:ATP-binding protein [Anaerolineales bacterium]
MPTPLLDRLNQARHRQFVGRQPELALFETVITAAELPLALIYVYGPGGIGKTSLLHEFGYICANLELPWAYLDLRDVSPAPDAFAGAVDRAIPSLSTASPANRQVILIDSYEKVLPLDNWLRQNYLPQLPADTLVVLAGRDKLSPRWRSDAGWRALIHELSLRNFSAQESETFLTARGIPSGQHRPILHVTHGHPLALSLIADQFIQQGDLFSFTPDKAPDMIKTLLDRLIQDIPGPAHRLALEACAQVHIITEPLLAAMLEIDDCYAIFDWLRGLSFVEVGSQGVFLHDLVGKTLSTDLQWRNPERYATLLSRARNYYTARLQQANSQEQQQIIADYIFLHRQNPIVRPFFDAASQMSVLVDAANAPDRPQLVEMVRRHEGDRSAGLAEAWFERQPHQILVMRSPSEEFEFAPLGFLFTLDLTADADLIAADPAAHNAWRYLQTQTLLRPGEKATMFRFWLSADTHQNFSPVVALIGVNMVRHYLTTPGLAYTFFPCANPQFWTPLCAYADLTRLPDVDFAIDNRTYGVFGHDWRVMPPLQWLDLLAGRENSLFFQKTPPPPPHEALIVLSRSEFSQAVRDVFRRLSSGDTMSDNPLLRSHLVLKAHDPGASDTEKMAYLQNLVIKTAETLKSSPRHLKLYRTLYHTYIQPAHTQEQAAELIDVPFSTFRRHLKAGLTEVANILWQQEIGY